MPRTKFDTTGTLPSLRRQARPTRQDQYAAQVDALSVYLAGGYDGLKKRYGEAKALTHYMAACRAVQRLQVGRARRKLATASDLRTALVSGW